MRKVTIFTEGQTELIFLCYLVGIEFGWDKIGIRCKSLGGNRSAIAGLNLENSHADILFQIIDVGSDGSVLSAIKEREVALFKAGFERIFGLRDMYSEDYLKRAGRNIVPAVINQFIGVAQGEIQKMSSPDKIFFHFAIMEVEAWFLAMCPVFGRIDAALTVQYIEEKLNFRIDQVDPQVEFVHPAQKVEHIFELIGSKYDKQRGSVELICGNIEHGDIQAVLASERCQSFKEFYADIMSPCA